MQQILTKEFLDGILAEATASKKCLERIPEKLWDYKPHEKSMPLGYLSLLVAEMPMWVAHMLEKGDIDFATFTHIKPKTTVDLVTHLDENIKWVKATLEKAGDDELKKDFSLKTNGKVVMTMPLGVSISSTIRHWMHHRGQLTVYMRLNNLLVPSIYGPSADEKNF